MAKSRIPTRLKALTLADTLRAAAPTGTDAVRVAEPLGSTDPFTAGVTFLSCLTEGGHPKLWPLSLILHPTLGGVEEEENVGSVTDRPRYSSP
jgi:hypothetical protein